MRSHLHIRVCAYTRLRPRFGAQGEYDAAIRDYDAAIAATPGNIRLHNNRCAGTGNHAIASTHVSHAIPAHLCNIQHCNNRWQQHAWRGCMDPQATHVCVRSWRCAPPVKRAMCTCFQCLEAQDELPGQVGALGGCACNREERQALPCAC